MERINVKEAMTEDYNLEALREELNVLNAYSHVSPKSANAEDFHNRHINLLKMADKIISIADGEDMPKELISKYNALAHICYEVSDLEYEFFKIYR